VDVRSQCGSAREIAASDDCTCPCRRPRSFLLARLPADGSGQIKLGSQKLEPIWFDRPLASLRQPRP
jgi:hypothetical protein